MVFAGGAAKLSSAAIELAGRSQLVLLAREFLYRECELAANFALDEQKYNELSKQYAQILDVVTDLARAEQKRAQAELQDALNKAAELNKGQDEEIARIIAHVTASDGSINRDALKKLLDSSKIDPSFKKSIQSRENILDLLEFLRAVPDSVTGALVAAIPKPE